jgi:hypothetical protein
MGEGYDACMIWSGRSIYAHSKHSVSRALLS